MAKERGWWSLDLGDQTLDDLTDVDIEHIAKLIKEGNTSGEIVQSGEDY